jgi:hypothetical protein
MRWVVNFLFLLLSVSSLQGAMKEGVKTRSNGALQHICEKDADTGALICMKFNTKGGLMEQSVYEQKGKKRHGPYRKYFGNNKQQQCPFIRWDASKNKMVSKTEINICVEPLRPKEVGQYTKGKKSGQWTYYYKDGSVKKTKNHSKKSAGLEALASKLDAFDLRTYAEVLDDKGTAERDRDHYVPRESEDDEDYEDEDESYDDESYEEDDTSDEEGEDDETYEEE